MMRKTINTSTTFINKYLLIQHTYFLDNLAKLYSHLGNNLYFSNNTFKYLFVDVKYKILPVCCIKFNMNIKYILINNVYY